MLKIRTRAVIVIGPESLRRLDRLEVESGIRIAQWGDADSSVVLYRSTYASGFRLKSTKR